MLLTICLNNFQKCLAILPQLDLSYTGDLQQTRDGLGIIRRHLNQCPVREDHIGRHAGFVCQLLALLPEQGKEGVVVFQLSLLLSFFLNPFLLLQHAHNFLPFPERVHRLRGEAEGMKFSVLLQISHM